VTILADLVEEFKEPVGSRDEPPILTLTEKNGFVLQSSRFNKRLATTNVEKYKIVRRNDLAFNPYLLWAGAVAQNTMCDEGAVSPLYPTFRVRSGFDPRFVGRLLLTPSIVKRYDSIAFGSVPRRRRSSVADFLALEIPDPPPIEEQRRIAAILDAADALRAKRQGTLAKLDTLTRAIFIEMFGEPSYGGPWPIEEVGDLISEHQLGLVRGAKDLAPDKAYPYVRMNAIKEDGELDLELAEVLRADATAEELHRYTLAAGDVLFNTRNTKSLVGKTAIFRGAGPFLFNNNILRLRFRDRIRPEFLNAVFRTRLLQDQLENRKSGTTSVYAVYFKSLKSVRVPVPPLDLQQRFEARVHTVRQQHEAGQASAASLDALFASLQQRAFRGEL
jgi:type I restriction enzyme, S subunit